jgi:uncharacterized protein YjcR
MVKIQGTSSKMFHLPRKVDLFQKKFQKMLMVCQKIVYEKITRKKNIISVGISVQVIFQGE